MASLWLLRPLLLETRVFGGAPLDWTNLGVLALVAGLGALLPDLDAAESKAKHLVFSFRLGGERIHVAPLSFPALVLSSTLTHRGPLHSLLGFVAVGVLIGMPLALVVSWTAAVALLLGWASHLALDACTKSGLPLLWPNLRRIRFLPPILRVTTGSDAESLVFALLASLSLALLLSALPGALSGNGFR